MSSQAGNLLAYTAYDEWGNVQNQKQLDMNFSGLDRTVNYTGHDYDEALEKYFAQARLYDPDSKRFLSPDPLGEGSNLYIYCIDNPTAFIDPNGLESVHIRDYVDQYKEKYGGFYSWNDVTRFSTFVLNSKSLASSYNGGVINGVTIRNEGGYLCAERTQLSIYFFGSPNGIVTGDGDRGTPNLPVPTPIPQPVSPSPSAYGSEPEILNIFGYGSVYVNVRNKVNLELMSGWKYRYEAGNPNNPGEHEHMHVFTTNGSQEYSQNDDGSPKDKPKEGTSPPNRVKKELKKKTGWDWDAKEKNWINKIKIVGPDESLGYYVYYPNDFTAWIPPLSYYLSRPISWKPSADYLIELYFGSNNLSNSSSGTSGYFIPLICGPVPVPVLPPVVNPIPVW
jgi:RHS repeat-associated protein